MRYFFRIVSLNLFLAEVLFKKFLTSSYAQSPCKVSKLTVFQAMNGNVYKVSVMRKPWRHSLIVAMFRTGQPCWIHFDQSTVHHRCFCTSHLFLLISLVLFSFLPLVLFAYEWAAESLARASSLAAATQKWLQTRGRIWKKLGSWGEVRLFLNAENSCNFR